MTDDWHTLPEESLTSSGVGDRIRLLRCLRGMSLRDVAKKAGVSHQTIHKFETGKQHPTTAQAIKLAEVFGIKVIWFWAEQWKLSAK